MPVAETVSRPLRIRPFAKRWACALENHADGDYTLKDAVSWPTWNNLRGLWTRLERVITKPADVVPRVAGTECACCVRRPSDD